MGLQFTVRALSTGSLALLLSACGNGAGFTASDKLQNTGSTNLVECTSEALTTGACKVSSVGVAITANTANITAANIKSGTTIFGVTGSLQGPLAACTDENLNSAACSAASNRYVTPTLGTNVNGTNAALATVIPSGYYDGTRSVTASDTNLVAANIRSGTSVFGVTGTLSAMLAACTNDALNSTACSTAANRYVTATLGANITGSNGNLVTTIPSGYHDGTRTVTASDTNLTAANIRSGTSVFGVTGTLAGAHAACSDNALNSAACSTATNRYVTATAGANVTGSNAALVTTIPAGYYDGTRTATASDTNLLATNIRSGTVVFGVTGTLSAMLAACTNDALNSSACSTAANRYVTATAGANVNGANAALVTTVPAGYYDGTQTVTASDTNLLATNIRSGTVVFGVTGTLSGMLAACTNDALNSSACSTAANRYVTATAGTNVSGANAALVTTVPSGYYDGTRTVTASDTNLVAGNIRSGVSVFGVTGSYAGSGGTFATFMASTQHHTAGATQLTLKQEGVDNAGTAYTNSSSAYRAVPSISGKDNDGTSGGSVVYVNRSSWGTASCGASGSIATRIADCAAHANIGSESTWNGAVKGNAGQGTWSLVSRTGAVGSGRGREVWRDNRTGLVWSSLVSSGTITWCRASGSNNITGNPTAEAGNGNYCTDSSNQNTGTYAGGAKAVSVCFEDGENYFTAGTATDAAGKAGLGRSSTPSVAWRLPTLYDYKLADVNGIRFVMNDMGTYNGGREWTATLYSDSAEYVKEAYAYGSAYGEVLHGPLNSAYSARCVGR